MEALAEPTKPIACISCGGPLAAREGEFFLKYFLIERPPKSAPGFPASILTPGNLH
jgi:hypothetical protein